MRKLALLVLVLACALTAASAGIKRLGAVTYPSPAGVPFPRLGAMIISGNQCMPTGTSGANDSAVAGFQYVIIAGNYDGWVTDCPARTRQAVVAAIKGYPQTGIHAVTPLVFQYENINETPQSSPWFGAWESAIACNNWWVYVTNSSGTLGESVYNSSYNIVDMADAAGTDGSGCTNTGLFPYQLAASLTYQQFIAGSSGTVSAAPNLDGMYYDNTSIRALAAGSYDWLRNGTQQDTMNASGSTAAINATIAGKEQLASWWAENHPSYHVTINSEAGYDLAPAAAGGLGMTTALGFNNLSGLFPYAMEQFMWCTFNAPNDGCSANGTLNWGGFADAVTWYQVLSAYTANPLLTGAVNPGAGGSGLSGSDAQLVRYSLAFTLVAGDGYAFYGTYNGDVDDYAQSTALPYFDEFYGGNRDLAGWLGAPLTSAQGAVQTAPWAGNIWRRDFQNGIVLVNGSSTGMTSGTCEGGSASTESLGGTYYHLNGMNAVNPGGAGITSVTLNPCDAIFLTDTGPN